MMFFSKEALKAHFVIISSDSAAKISVGISSPAVRSYTTTGPLSTETPKSSIWFCPLDDEIAHRISKKYQLYK